MSALYVPFKSIEEIKERGEFIPKGRIYPARIMKSSKRKYQCKFVSGANQWAIPTPTGYMVFVENNDGEFQSVVFIKNNSINGDIDVNGSIYHNGHSDYYGNNNSSDVEFLHGFNSLFLSKCLFKDGIHDNSEQLKINLDYAGKLDEG